MGLERLVMLLSDESKNFRPPVDIYWVSPDVPGFHWGHDYVYRWRQEGIRVERDLQAKSMKAQMKRANKLKARLCVIIGETEIQKGEATVKDMAAGTEISVEFSKLKTVLVEMLENKS
jgi:histidyl-tRNA synthetase